ncbi:MAG: hypothetical protein K8T90_12850 [Planctomycetes bacterium]|nr:hypothetical protein [Planctomycetota bacterium]
MYLTAMLVRTAVGDEGINAFAYAHRGHVIPSLADGSPDISRVAEFEPGECIEEVADVRPGGNSVVGYLDVVAPDDATRAEVEATLVQLRGAIARPKSPWTVFDGRVGARLGVALGVDTEARAGSAFQRLADRVVRLLPLRDDGQFPSPQACGVWVRVLPGRVELSLPPASRARTINKLSGDARVVLSSEALMAFPGGLQQALIEGALMLFPGVPRDTALTGGVRFIDPETGVTLYESPTGAAA